MDLWTALLFMDSVSAQNLKDEYVGVYALHTWVILEYDG